MFNYHTIATILETSYESVVTVTYAKANATNNESSIIMLKPSQNLHLIGIADY